MQVQQQVDLGDQRLDLAGTVELDRAAVAVQHAGAPDAVHVLVDEARGARIGRVEAGIGGDVAEDQGEFALRRAELLAQQQVERMGAADLVAMDQRGDADIGAGPAGIELEGIGHAGIALTVLGDRDRQQGVFGQGGHGTWSGKGWALAVWRRVLSAIARPAAKIALLPEKIRRIRRVAGQEGRR